MTRLDLEKGEAVAVRARRSEPGKGLSYEDFTGTLLEYCNGEGWDVVDVQHAKTGEVISVYSFSVKSILHPY